MFLHKAGVREGSKKAASFGHLPCEMALLEVLWCRRSVTWECLLGKAALCLRVGIGLCVLCLVCCVCLLLVVFFKLEEKLGQEISFLLIT